MTAATVLCINQQLLLCSLRHSLQQEMALKTAALDSSSEYQEQLNDLQGQLSASQAAEEAAATQLSFVRQQVSRQLAADMLTEASKSLFTPVGTTLQSVG